MFSIKRLIFTVRKLFWRILGIDYQQMLRITDYVFLKKDIYTTIGRNTYDNGAIVFRWSNAPIVIGNYCSIANNVRFIVDDGGHIKGGVTDFPLVDNLFRDQNRTNLPFEKFNTSYNTSRKQGIKIGNDVWIGMSSFILPGVKIGNGVTIGANSVVTKDIPDYAVVVGSPARIISTKHSDETIIKLNAIAWWDWETTTIKERIEDFNLPGNQFADKYEQSVK